MIDKKIMTPEDSRWGEFCALLEGPEGCNFKKESGARDYTWDCTSTNERPHARRLLERMGYDVELSIAYFDEHGGHCDCEILFNVSRRVQTRQSELKQRREIRKRRRLQ